MKIVSNFRFDERHSWFNHIKKNTEHLTNVEIDKILDGFDHFDDLTFKFYSNGSVKILDNSTEEFIQVSDLKSFAYQYYIQKRLEQLKLKEGIKIGRAS